jgi:hypothetical protein
MLQRVFLKITSVNSADLFFFSFFFFLFFLFFLFFFFFFQQNGQDTLVHCLRKGKSRVRQVVGGSGCERVEKHLSHQDTVVHCL